MSDPGGKCVLIDVEGLDNLPLYFQSSYGYLLPRDTALPFEVKAIKLSIKVVKLKIAFVKLVNRRTQAFSHVPQKIKKVCRFNYTQPPMRSTQIYSILLKKPFPKYFL